MNFIKDRANVSKTCTCDDRLKAERVLFGSYTQLLSNLLIHKFINHFRDKSNKKTTKLYDKRHAFGFHIVNFPFVSSNISSAPGVYEPQLIRYARYCSNYGDFISRHNALMTRLL